MNRLLIMGFLFGAAAFSLLSCQKELSVESASNTASFSLLSDSSKCLMEPEVNGNYYNGVTAALSGNFVTVVVNVKATGNYTLSTISQNGFSFRDSGFFSKLGIDTLILKPLGKPILIGLTDFSFSNDSTACPFTVDVQDSTGSGLGGVDTSGNVTFPDSSYVDPKPAADSVWQFTDSATNNTYSGIFPVNGVIDVEDNVSTLYLDGYTADLTKEFEMYIDLPTGAVTTGIYQILNSDNEIDLTTVADGTDLYYSDEDVARDGTSNSYVNITSVTNVDAATIKVQGSFHCWSEDDQSNPPTLIKGSFNCLVKK